jgi:S-adenosylmethionine:tRNA ribosyltransferase-isomerase
MKLSDYDYPLDAGQIAQEPVPQRDHARLMIVNRRTGQRLQRRFFEITKFFKRGDLLVLNDTRVIQARLSARKETGGEVELFLLRDLGENRWEALIRGKVVPETQVILEDGKRGVVEEMLPDGKRVVHFQGELDLYNYMERYGSVPVPPYIHRNGDPAHARLDKERYQTVYAQNAGAVAAPTAGLHFTEELLSSLQEMGVQVVFVTLHVGYGTFKPVTAEDIREHEMDREVYSISDAAALSVNQAVREKRRVIAVGTTCTRALESAADEQGVIIRTSGATNLFIYPGYKFRVISGLITNFHLPKSTLLMLVAAFTGKELLDQAYREASDMDYRFYSYGDAMLIK